MRTTTFVPVKITTFIQTSFQKSQSQKSVVSKTSAKSVSVVTASAISRRQLLVNLSATIFASLVSQTSQKPALARNGLRIFPLQERLTNTYYLMRACETASDRLGIVHSNPVNKLSVEMHALTSDGVDQAILASNALEKAGLGPGSWIWPSTTTSSIETADILAYNLKVRREQIVPEYSFLDMRGVGAMDGGKATDVRHEIAEHDKMDSNWKPIAGEDGTPNDSTEDVFVRVRQLLSKLETQYFGDDIIIVSPDSDPLSILQASLIGSDLRLHHTYDYRPGEVRCVQELVVDSHGNTIVEPSVKILSKPVKVRNIRTSRT